MEDFVISREDYEEGEKFAMTLNVDPVIRNAEDVLKYVCLLIDGPDQLELLQLIFSFKERIHFVGICTILREKCGIDRSYIKKVLRCLIDDDQRANLIKRIARRRVNNEKGYFEKGVSTMISEFSS